MYLIKDSKGKFIEKENAIERDKYLNSLDDTELLSTTLYDVVNVKTFQVEKRIVPVKVIKENVQE